MGKFKVGDKISLTGYVHKDMLNRFPVNEIYYTNEVGEITDVMDLYSSCCIKTPNVSGFVSQEDIIIYSADAKGTYSWDTSEAVSSGDEYSLREFKDKTIDGISDYIIFFDDVRVDKYVKRFNTQVANDGGIGTATIEMIYTPSFYSLGKANTISNGGIDYMTQVYIFTRNMFTGAYTMIFCGNIVNRSLSRSHGDYSISFTAKDDLIWFKKAYVPLNIGTIDESYLPGEALKWYARGVDIANVDIMGDATKYSIKGKTITEWLKVVQAGITENNPLFNAEDSVSKFSDVFNCIQIMGDIDDTLVKSKVLDYNLYNSSTSINSLYVCLNEILGKLMFEFFQDIDGFIRIKPPFWNEPVLYSHVIDPSMIISMSEQSDWESFMTRAITVGSVDEQFETLGARDRSWITPAGCYVGSVFSSNARWSDWTQSTSNSSETTQDKKE